MLDFFSQPVDFRSVSIPQDFSFMKMLLLDSLHIFNHLFNLSGCEFFNLFDVMVRLLSHMLNLNLLRIFHVLAFLVVLMLVFSQLILSCYHIISKLFAEMFNCFLVRANLLVVVVVLCVSGLSQLNIQVGDLRLQLSKAVFGICIFSDFMFNSHPCFNLHIELFFHV